MGAEPVRLSLFEPDGLKLWDKIGDTILTTMEILFGEVWCAVELFIVTYAFYYHFKCRPCTWGQAQQARHNHISFTEDKSRIWFTQSWTPMSWIYYKRIHLAYTVNYLLTAKTCMGDMWKYDPSWNWQKLGCVWKRWNLCLIYCWPSSIPWQDVFPLSDLCTNKLGLEHYSCRDSPFSQNGGIGLCVSVSISGIYCIMCIYTFYIVCLHIQSNVLVHSQNFHLMLTVSMCSVSHLPRNCCNVVVCGSNTWS